MLTIDLLTCRDIRSDLDELVWRLRDLCFKIDYGREEDFIQEEYDALQRAIKLFEIGVDLLPY